MKTIVLFGAGKSSASCINYLAEQAEKNSWKFIVVDSDYDLIVSKSKNFSNIFAKTINVANDSDARNSLIKAADIVISLMPPSLHFTIAKDCVNHSKTLLTASYLDENIKSLEEEIINKNILFIAELGLDPGIDHMSAMKLIDSIKNKSGKIKSFISHCGGLIAPESDDNPWHYKISWNPKNIVLAGKYGAVYLQNGEKISKNYSELFTDDNKVQIPINEIGELSCYPNRDSLPYIELYNLKNIKTFIRTTLRHHDFISGWRAIVNLKLTDEEIKYNSDNISFANFFEEHLKKNNLEQEYEELDKSTKFKIDFLGFNDSSTMINKGFLSPAEILQILLEEKLALCNSDKDMIVLMHELEYEENNIQKKLSSSLIVKGENSTNTAMAKTVGLPLAITATLILQGKINLTGLHIPTAKEIYEPVLKELETQGIVFEEKEI